MAIVSSSLFYKTRNEATTFSYPVSGAIQLFAGQLVGVTSDGYLQPATNSATFLDVGVCSTDVDNLSGDPGDVYAEIYQDGEVTINTVGSIAANAPVYVSDDSKVAVSGSNATAGVFVGTAHQLDSGTRWFVKLGVRPGRTGYGTQF